MPLGDVTQADHTAPRDLRKATELIKALAGVVGFHGFTARASRALSTA